MVSKRMKKEVKAIVFVHNILSTLNSSVLRVSQKLMRYETLPVLGYIFKAGMNNFSHELLFQEEVEIFIYQHFRVSC